MNTAPNTATEPRQSQPQDYPIEFSAQGREYFGIWIVNLLLTLLTAGLYYPWAKVRKLKYFYGNTRVGGHALDFHGSPAKMLRGTLLAGLFLVVYSKASEMPGWPALIGALALVAVAPALFYSSMRFRMANTSWRGMRFEFTGAVQQSYLTVGVMLFLALVPLTLLRLNMPVAGRGAAGAASIWPVIFGMYALFALLFPYLLWRIQAYQHGNYALGRLRTEFRCGAKEFYGITLKTIGLMLLGVAVLVGPWAAMLLPLNGSGANKWALLFWLPVILLLVYLFVYVVVLSYWKVAMQNKVWSRTGNNHMRFVSRLKFRKYLKLQFRNYLWIVLTLGFYWPFAVVASRRMLLENMVLRTRHLSLDHLTARAAPKGEAAVGDAAADLFGLDVGI